MDQEQRDRWWSMLAQADRFAETDNAVDALARARRVVEEVEDALEQATDARVTERLERMLASARRAEATFEQHRESWDQRVKERQARFLEREAEDYRSPLPTAGRR